MKLYIWLGVEYNCYGSIFSVAATSEEEARDLWRNWLLTQNPTLTEAQADRRTRYEVVDVVLDLEALSNSKPQVLGSVRSATSSY